MCIVDWIIDEFVCFAGTFCIEGSSSEVSCLAGTYNPISEQSACLNCPAGYYCTAGATAIADCPLGQ
jgi:hypothetical protein